MHILLIPYVFPNPENPTSGIFVKEQAIALSEAGIKIGVVWIELKKITKFFSYPFLPLKTKSKINNIPVFYKSGINYLPKMPFYQEYAWKTWIEELYLDYIKEHGKPDIIHAHFGLWAGYGAKYIAGKYRIPFVLTEHSTYIAEGKFTSHEIGIHKQVYHKAVEIITVSDSLRQQVSKLTTKKNIIVIPNIIDTEKFKTSEAEPSNYFFSLGNLVPQKGFDILIKAFAGFSKKHPQYRLIIGGEGYQLKELIKMVNSHQLEGLVEFTGTLTQSEVIRFMQNAKAFVLPSRHETFGVVFAEALACGIPVVATRCGGPEEYVKPGYGFVCEPENIEEVQEAMEKALHQAYDKMAMHNYIAGKFSKQVVLSQLVKSYNRWLT